MNSSEFSVETYMTISRTENFLVSSPNKYSGVTVLSIMMKILELLLLSPIQDKISLRFHKDEVSLAMIIMAKIVNNYVYVSLPDVTLFLKAVCYSGIV